MQRSGLIATKIGNSSYFQNDGTNAHVTILKVDECVVSRIKTIEGLSIKSIDYDRIVAHPDAVEFYSQI